ncbi:hypothetical protein ACLKA6_012002 [Drosophila palustris]
MPVQPIAKITGGAGATRAATKMITGGLRRRLWKLASLQMAPEQGSRADWSRPNGVLGGHLMMVNHPNVLTPSGEPQTGSMTYPQSNRSIAKITPSGEPQTGSMTYPQTTQQ